MAKEVALCLPSASSDPFTSEEDEKGVADSNPSSSGLLIGAMVLRDHINVGSPIVEDCSVLGGSRGGGMVVLTMLALRAWFERGTGLKNWIVCTGHTDCLSCRGGLLYYLLQDKMIVVPILASSIPVPIPWLVQSLPFYPFCKICWRRGWLRLYSDQIR